MANTHAATKAGKNFGRVDRRLKEPHVERPFVIEKSTHEVEVMNHGGRHLRGPFRKVPMSLPKVHWMDDSAEGKV